MQSIELSRDRVRNHSSNKANQKIDLQTERNINEYSSRQPIAIRARLAELDREWDIERSLELTSGLNVLIGLGLGLTVNRKWLLLSAVSAAFLVQHTLQGWCPPLPVFRALGVRTRNEILKEREELVKALNKEEITY